MEENTYARVIAIQYRSSAIELESLFFDRLRRLICTAKIQASCYGLGLTSEEEQ
jgi:hypothetical protein